MRIQLSNMRVEARSVTEQRNILEQAERNAKTEAESAIKEANSLKMKLSKMETQSESLRTSLRNVNEQKIRLEDTLEQLQDQLLSLKGKESELSAVASEHRRQHEQTQQVMKDTLVKHQDNHKKELDDLEAQIASKEQLIAELQE